MIAQFFTFLWLLGTGAGEAGISPVEIDLAPSPTFDEAGEILPSIIVPSEPEIGAEDVAIPTLAPSGQVEFVTVTQTPGVTETFTRESLLIDPEDRFAFRQYSYAESLALQAIWEAEGLIGERP